MPKMNERVKNTRHSGYQFNSLSIDKFNSYLRCGEYFRNETTGFVPAYSPNINQYEALLESLLLYIVSYKALSGYVPGESEIAIKFAENQANLNKQGYPFMFINKSNDVFLSSLSWSNFVKALPIVDIASQQSYISNGISVEYFVPIITKSSIYLITSLSKREFLRSCFFHFPLINNIDKQINVVSINSGTFSIYTVDEQNLDLAKLKSFYNSVLFALSKDVYMPIYNCRLNSCPLYLTCNPMYKDIDVPI